MDSNLVRIPPLSKFLHPSDTPPPLYTSASLDSNLRILTLPNHTKKRPKSVIHVRRAQGFLILQYSLLPRLIRYRWILARAFARVT